MSLYEDLPWLPAATRAVQERAPGMSYQDAETLALVAVGGAHALLKIEFLADLADVLTELGETGAATWVDEACSAARSSLAEQAAYREGT